METVVNYRSTLTLRELGDKGDLFTSKRLVNVDNNSKDAGKGAGKLPRVYILTVVSK